MTESTDLIIQTRDPAKGRGIFAQNSFSAGETIVIEAPYVSAYLPPQYEAGNFRTCENCLKAVIEQQHSPPQASDFRCKKCGDFFCSEACFRDAEKTWHPPLCKKPEESGSASLKRLKDYAYQDSNVNFLLVVKIYATMIQSMKANGHDFDEAYDPLRILYKYGCSASDMTPSLKERVEKYALCISGQPTFSNAKFPKSLLLLLLLLLLQSKGNTSCSRLQFSIRYFLSFLSSATCCFSVRSISMHSC